MATRTRALQPLLLRRLPQRTTWLATHAPARRSLASASAPVIYTAHARVTGGRAAGHIVGDSGAELDLAPPQAMGGSGAPGKTNPEELFAAGYGACFQSAMNATARTMGVKLPEGKDESVVEAEVRLFGEAKELDFGLRVDLKVKVAGIERQVLEKVLERTKEICPYSRATKGNVETVVEIV